MSEEQSPKETAKAYAAFVEYCALGSARSLRKLAENRGQTEGKSGVRLATLEEWSSQHNWQERVKQYDAERAEEKRIARERAREEAEDRHAEQAQEEQEIARGVIKKGAVKGHISMSAVQLLKNSREDERKALGMDESTTKTKLEIAGKDGGPITILRMPDNGDDDEQKQEEASE